MSMKCSVETECGYTLRVEGTSVEYVLARPGGKFNIKKHLSQNYHANFWDFKMGINKTPGSVVTCQRVILKYLNKFIKEGKLQWQKQLYQVKKLE